MAWLGSNKILFTKTGQNWLTDPSLLTVAYNVASLYTSTQWNTPLEVFFYYFQTYQLSVSCLCLYCPFRMKQILILKSQPFFKSHLKSTSSLVNMTFYAYFIYIILTIVASLIFLTCSSAREFIFPSIQNIFNERNYKFCVMLSCYGNHKKNQRSQIILL